MAGVTRRISRGDPASIGSSSVTGSGGHGGRRGSADVVTASPAITGGSADGPAVAVWSAIGVRATVMVILARGGVVLKSGLMAH